MNSNTEQQQEVEEPDTKPDEDSGIVVQGFLKITDPESGEIILQGRA
jgi:hypothetical protein